MIKDLVKIYERHSYFFAQTDGLFWCLSKVLYSIALASKVTLR